jgi:4'-phosphopantetheinyl transferase
LQVSVSRTSGAILVGLAKGCRLGIDVENLRDVPEEEIDALAARWFCEYDAARIAAHPRGDRARAFLELWTRAEAYSKALGVGLALDFAEAGPFLRAGAAMPAQSLRIEPLDLDAEFVGAVAYAGAGRRIAVDRWTSVEVLLERDAAAMAT